MNWTRVRVHDETRAVKASHANTQMMHDDGPMNIPETTSIDALDSCPTSHSHI